MEGDLSTRFLVALASAFCSVVVWRMNQSDDGGEGGCRDFVPEFGGLARNGPSRGMI